MIWVIVGYSLLTPVAAQNRPEINTAGVASIPISFFPPGARALGMGSAFIGVADDATAAESNPAGLTVLSEPEFSLHLRYADRSIEFDEANIYSFNDAVGANAESRYPLEDSGTRVSFASVVKPLGQWVVSAFYQEAVVIDAAPQVQALAPGTPFSATFDSFLDLSLQHTGVSLSYRLNDAISLGLAIRNSQVKARSGKLSRFDFGALDSFLEITEDVTIDDDAITFTAGLLVNLSGRWSFGAVYKEGGSFELVASGLFNDQRPGMPPISFGFGPIIQDVDVPDVFGVGLGWRPSDTLLLSFDLNHISYGDLQDPNVLLDPALQGIVEEVDDEITLHFGIENAFLLEGPIQLLTLRGGVFTDPDHDNFARVDSDNTHVTLGVGIVFGSLQFDLAADFSSDVDTAILSMIYRF
jgi:long-chain fatty acid transport protein